MYLDSLNSGPYSDVAYAVVAAWVASGSRFFLMAVCRDVKLYRHSELLYLVYSILTTKNSMQSAQLL